MPYLYELENRVFTESWSIPYKREESLGRCLIAATRLAQEGLDCDLHEGMIIHCRLNCLLKIPILWHFVNFWNVDSAVTILGF